MLIEADGLSVRRLGRVVLREVSLCIGDGECISIIGPNGAGKSTLMAALVGLLPAEAGAVRLDGKAIRRLRRRAVARQIAYVPQIHDGYMGFRVRDVVEAGRYAHVDPLDPLSDEDRSAIDEAVEACRIHALLDRPMQTLSGGERQKAWLAAALAQQTPALFLDEPTNALDPAHQAELIRIMRRFHEAGRTLLVICHDLNLAMALGGRVVAIQDGQLFFDEPVQVLQDVQRLYELFGTEFTLFRSAADDQTSVQLRV